MKLQGYQNESVHVDVTARSFFSCCIVVVGQCYQNVVKTDNLFCFTFSWIFSFSFDFENSPEESCVVDSVCVRVSLCFLYSDRRRQGSFFSTNIPGFKSRKVLQCPYVATYVFLIRSSNAPSRFCFPIENRVTKLDG